MNFQSFIEFLEFLNLSYFENYKMQNARPHPKCTQQSAQVAVRWGQLTVLSAVDSFHIDWSTGSSGTQQSVSVSINWVLLILILLISSGGAQCL